LVTELTDELKYDIVVPLTTSVGLPVYQFFLSESDVVIFVEKSNDDNKRAITVFTRHLFWKIYKQYK